MSLLHTPLQVCLRVWRPISFCEKGQRPARGLDCVGKTFSRVLS